MAPATPSKEAARDVATSRAGVGGSADLIFKALDSAPRRKILRLLAESATQDPPDCCSPASSVCACVFVEKLGLTPPTVSHHMRVLLDAGLVSAEKRGLWVHYRMNSQGMEVLLDELKALGSFGAGGCG